MGRALQLASLLAVSFTPLAALSADWPTEGGSNARLMSTADTLPVPLEAQWTYQAAAAPKLAWSSGEGRTIEGKLLGSRIRFDDAFRTVVAGGRVYFGSTVDHQLHCRADRVLCLAACRICRHYVLNLHIIASLLEPNKT